MTSPARYDAARAPTVVWRPTFPSTPGPAASCRRGTSSPAPRLRALSFGLTIGGAIGNGVDRLAYGAVADFVLLPAETATWRFNWYVFNLADVAIVAGVGGLLYESLWGDSAPKAP